MGQIPLEAAEVAREERIRIRRTTGLPEMPENAGYHPEIGAAGQIKRGTTIAETLDSGLLQGTHAGTPGIHEGAINIEQPERRRKHTKSGLITVLRRSLIGRIDLGRIVGLDAFVEALLIIIVVEIIFLHELAMEEVELPLALMLGQW